MTEQEQKGEEDLKTWKEHHYHDPSEPQQQQKSADIQQKGAQPSGDKPPVEGTFKVSRAEAVEEVDKEKKVEQKKKSHRHREKKPAPPKKTKEELRAKKYKHYDYEEDDDPIEDKKIMETMAEFEKDAENMDEIFSLSLKLKYSKLQLNSASSTVEPLLCTLKTKSLANKTRMPLDLICVLDVSGSMVGEKIELLKQTLNYLLVTLEETDRLSIVEFSTNARRLTPLLRVNKQNNGVFKEAINSLKANGGTDITSGMEIAGCILEKRRYRNPVTSIFLLSDGLDEEGQDGTEEVLENMDPQEHFTVYSFGYGQDHDPKMMNAIAKMKDGNFYFIEKYDTVDECFVDAIGALISVVGEDISLNVQAVQSDIFPTNAITFGFGGKELWKTTEGIYSTHESQISSGRSRNYVLELTIPKCDLTLKDDVKQIALAKATVTVKQPRTGKIWSNEIEVKAKVYNEEDDMVQDEPDKDVLVNLYRYRFAELLVASMELAVGGNYEAGRKLLENFKEELVGSPVRSEPMVEGLLQDLDKALTEMVPEVFESSGKHRMVQQSESHKKEKSNPFSKNSKNIYSNDVQRAMVNAASKNKK
eukprot:CAMPEP_0176474580 /NCGR_PEP_ID=MMETSP0127-20121128/43086_1 /TAXON_ID=938130 /ORGANISM="Platyophrya macrostoma, Strain WH" /LENGTH=588 /DNA_ID=CAMNT_0017869993 /DNA_START=57 /DNA_END=1823 /DNA_ORIENTATION=-